MVSIFGLFNDLYAWSKDRVQNPISDPSLFSIWAGLQSSFFKERLDLLDYEVIWSSRRQKRVLASITYRDKRVRVAKELKHPDYFHLLEPLLYHEMCHAVIGVSVDKRNGKRLWHGSKFKQLERLHPGTKLLDQWIKAGGWLRAIRRDRARR